MIAVIIPYHTFYSKVFRDVAEDLKAHRQIYKKWCAKSIVHVIKHCNFQLYSVHTNGVIYKT